MVVKKTNYGIAGTAIQAVGRRWQRGITPSKPTTENQNQVVGDSFQRSGLGQQEMYPRNTPRFSSRQKNLPKFLPQKSLQNFPSEGAVGILQHCKYFFYYYYWYPHGVLPTSTTGMKVVEEFLMFYDEYED